MVGANAAVLCHAVRQEHTGLPLLPHFPCSLALIPVVCLAARFLGRARGRTVRISTHALVCAQGSEFSSSWVAERRPLIPGDRAPGRYFAVFLLCMGWSFSGKCHLVVVVGSFVAWLQLHLAGSFCFRAFMLFAWPFSLLVYFLLRNICGQLSFAFSASMPL